MNETSTTASSTGSAARRGPSVRAFVRSIDDDPRIVPEPFGELAAARRRRHRPGARRAGAGRR